MSCLWCGRSGASWRAGLHPGPSPSPAESFSATVRAAGGGRASAEPLENALRGWKRELASNSPHQPQNVCGGRAVSRAAARALNGVQVSAALHPLHACLTYSGQQHCLLRKQPVTQYRSNALEKSTIGPLAVCASCCQPSTCPHVTPAPPKQEGTHTSHRHRPNIGSQISSYMSQL